MSPESGVLFRVPFDEIGPMVEGTPAAARQLASRARRRVRGQAPAADPDLAKQRAVVIAAGRTLSVMGFTVTEGCIVAIDVLYDPERLAALDLSFLDGDLAPG